MHSIYLDHNSTTPLSPDVAAAMAECDAAGYANPASQHAPGRRARHVVEEARDAIGRILGAEMSGHRPDRVIFTSGGTEANNLALLGLTAANEASGPGEIIVSAIEHPSVAEPARVLEQRGWTVHRLNVDRQGVVDLEALARLVNPQVRLVSTMLGNNETGVLQPVRQAAAICQAAGAPMHTDAVQVVGKLPVSFRELGVTAMTMSAHKLHGPRGIGALVVRDGASLSPLVFGGFQQGGLRPGTESVTLAVGLRAALEAWQRDHFARIDHMRSLRDHFEAALAAGYPQLVVNGRDAERLPHTSNLAFVGLERQPLLMALDLAGVACSTGSACASGSSEPSPVLLAMDCPDDVVASSLRFSLGAGTTVEEIDEAVQRILGVCAKLSATGARRPHSIAAKR